MGMTPVKVKLEGNFIIFTVFIRILLQRQLLSASMILPIILDCILELKCTHVVTARRTLVRAHISDMANQFQHGDTVRAPGS